MRLKNPRGIALVIVLTVLGILVTLTGAFITINHANFGLMASARDQEEATQACYSGFYFALYSVEHNKAWGKNNFTTNVLPTPADLAEVADLLDVEVVNGYTLRCYPKDADGDRMGSSMLLEVRNNLASDWADAPGPGEDPLPATGQFPAVPWNCLFVRVTGTSGGVTRQLESVLTSGPPYDASATANGQIYIEADNQLTVDSKDPYRNLMRSKGDMNLVPSGNTNDLKFRWTATAALDSMSRKGMLWANNRIQVAGYDMSDPNPATNKRAEVQTNSQGTVSPFARKSYTIEDLDFNDFRMEQSTPKVSIMDGEYVFGVVEYSVTYDRIDQVVVGYDLFGNAITAPQLNTYTQTAAYPALERKVGGVNERMWIKATDRPMIGGGFNGGTITNVTASRSAGREIIDADGIINLADLVPDGTSVPGGVPADKVRVDIEQADFRVGNNVLLVTDSNADGTADGNFALTSEIGGAPGPGQARQTDAKLYLGVDTMTGTVPPNAQPGAIQTAGTLSVREARGTGALVAGGNLTIQAGGTVETDPRMGIALFSGNNVIMDANQLPYGTANVTTVVDTKFRGLVYAENDFVLRAQSISNPKKIDIEGALVARNGSIRIEQSDSVTLTYNPVFLQQMLKDRPNNRIRLERQSFNLN